MRVWLGLESLMSYLTPLELNHFLQICSISQALFPGKQVHQQIIVNGLNFNSFLHTKLIQMYADCNDLTSARKMFDKLSQPNVFAWTSVIGCYSRNGCAGECLRTYRELKLQSVVPDGYVFPKVLRACSMLSCRDIGSSVHKDVIAFGSEFNMQVCNSMIHMYAKCGDIKSAGRVFNEMLVRDLMSWNSMISGYVLNELPQMAVDLLGNMRLNGFEADIVTYNTVVDAYCRMGSCHEALKVFQQITEPNIISWTTLISGYSRIGEHGTSLKFFSDMMIKAKVLPDLDCLSSALVSCRYLGYLANGKEIHSYGLKTSCGNAFYHSAGPVLLTMYAQCGRFDDACNIFNMMDKLDVVTWNAMIVGLIALGLEHSALECFREMQREGVRSDHTTLSSLLPVSDLKSGIQIHAYIKKKNFISVVPVCNALIHMYSKCGSIADAYSVFSCMVIKDIVSWNTMIGGFGKNGLGMAALKLVQEMTDSNLCPNSMTLTSALSACSHSGLVDEGVEVFYRLIRDFDLTPRMEHFASVVDLLARDGRLEDAFCFINRMPIDPDEHIWGALIAACEERQDIKVGKMVSERLMILEPSNAGHYVTLSNIYASAGRWDDAVEVRRLMESQVSTKPSGCSVLGSGN